MGGIPGKIGFRNRPADRLTGFDHNSAHLRHAATGVSAGRLTGCGRRRRAGGGRSTYYLVRLLDDATVRIMAAPQTTHPGTYFQREEIQCRNIGLLAKQIALHLRALGVPAIPLADSEVL